GRVEPRAVCLGTVFRDQLDRYGERELLAQRWRAAVAELPEGAALVVNGDDPQVGDLAAGRQGAVTFGLDDPRHASPELQHAADSKWCIRCGTPYHYAAAYIGHLGDYRCPNCGHTRPPLDLVARAIELNGLESVSFELFVPEGSRRVELAVPGLYNVYNALAAAGLTRALGVDLNGVVAGLQGFSAAFGRFERIVLGDRTLLVLLIKNPAGANEVVRTLVVGGPPRTLLVALNDEIADGRDISWIWDVDFEPLLGSLDRLVATGERAAELALRFKYAGLPAGAIEVEPSLEEALDRGLELTPAGGELVALPTYTAMLALRDLVAQRGFVRPYWEVAAAGGFASGTSFRIASTSTRTAATWRFWRSGRPGVATSSGWSRWARTTSCSRGSTTSTTSAEARTGSRSWSLPRWRVTGRRLWRRAKGAAAFAAGAAACSPL